jgi:ABC-type branched-subunit amino acid transport system ATPase component
MMLGRAAGGAVRLAAATDHVGPRCCASVARRHAASMSVLSITTWSILTSRGILLDEPTAALSPALVLQVLGLIQSLLNLGIAALVVEQRARQSLDISDRVIFSAAAVMTGAARALLADDQMTRHYLGRA